MSDNDDLLVIIKGLIDGAGYDCDMEMMYCNEFMPCISVHKDFLYISRIYLDDDKIVVNSVRSMSSDLEARFDIGDPSLCSDIISALDELSGL